MKRRHTKAKPQIETATLDEIQIYIEQLCDHHQQEWHKRLIAPAPDWTYLLGLHLRIVELEHMQPAVEELL